jgi:hypothetical protein
METGKLFSINKIQNETIVPLSEAEFSRVIHPSSDWTILTDFDYPITKIHTFSKHATLRDLLEWIVSDHCYGFFEGLKKYHSVGSVFILEWGV